MRRADPISWVGAARPQPAAGAESRDARSEGRDGSRSVLAGGGQRRQTAARSDERARVSAREPHRIRESTMSRRSSVARRDFVGVGNRCNGHVSHCTYFLLWCAGLRRLTRAGWRHASHTYESSGVTRQRKEKGVQQKTERAAFRK